MTNLEGLEAQLQSLLASGPTYGLGRAARALLEEIALRRHYAEGQSGLDVSGLGTGLRVQIGGGVHTLDGWLDLDIVPPADLLWDIREGLPFADGQCATVFSEHCLEHLDYPRSVKLLVSEMHRVLAPGGQVILGVPDAAMVIRAYVDRDMQTLTKYLETWYHKRDCLGDFNTPIDWVNYVLRDQEDHPVYHPHFWGYDLEKLISLFANAGFGRVCEWEFDPALANPARQWGSVYVIATR